jgi:hypothetical protein
MQLELTVDDRRLRLTVVRALSGSLPVGQLEFRKDRPLCTDSWSSRELLMGHKPGSVKQVMLIHRAFGWERGKRISCGILDYDCTSSNLKVES